LGGLRALFGGLSPQKPPRGDGTDASIIRHPCAYYSTRTLFTHGCKLQKFTVMNINYYHGNALKRAVEHTQRYVSAVRIPQL